MYSNTDQQYIYRCIHRCYSKCKSRRCEITVYNVTKSPAGSDSAVHIILFAAGTSALLVNAHFDDYGGVVWP